MTTQPRTVVAALSDLMFTVKIQEAAKRAGLTPVFVNSAADALAQVKLNPVALIIDLNNAPLDPLALIDQLKSDEATSKVKLIGYVSHVQVELKQAAQEKGCDMVVARSAFVQNLPELLKRYSE
jgi:CheY-like chemotaxis protein